MDLESYARLAIYLVALLVLWGVMCFVRRNWHLFFGGAIYPGWLIVWLSRGTYYSGVVHFWFFMFVAVTYWWQWGVQLGVHYFLPAVHAGWGVVSMEYVPPVMILGQKGYDIVTMVLWWLGWNMLCGSVALIVFYQHKDCREQLEKGLRKAFQLKDEPLAIKWKGRGRYVLQTENAFIDVGSLINVKSKIETAAKLNIVSIEEGIEKGEFIFLIGELPIDKKQRVADVSWNRVLKDADEETETRIAFCHNGVSADYWDLQKLPHVLLVGKQGGGKTTTGYALIKRFIENNPQTLVVIADNRKAGNNYFRLQWDPRLIANADEGQEYEFAKYTPKLRNVLLLETDEQYVQFTKVLEDELAHRARIYKENWVGDAFEMRENYGEDGAPFTILVVIEELLSLHSSGIKKLEEAYKKQMAMAFIGRDRPVNFILTAQMGPQRIIGDIRNQTFVLCFGTKPMENEYLLDHKNIGLPLINGVFGYNLPDSRASIALAATPWTTQDDVGIALAEAEQWISPENLERMGEMRRQMNADAHDEFLETAAAGVVGILKAEIEI